MKAHRALYPVATQCRVLGVSKSGYYLPARSAQAGAWLKRPISKRAAADLVLKERIVAIHTRSFGIYLPVRRTQTGGAPRIHAQLAFEGTRVGRKRVARLLREMGLMGVSRPACDEGRQVQKRAHDKARPAGKRCCRSGQSGLQGLCTRSALSGRHHLRIDLGRLPLPFRGSGCLLKTHRRMGDGHPPSHPAGLGCPKYGLVAASSQGRDPSFRPGIAVYLSRLWSALQKGRRPSL